MVVSLLVVHIEIVDVMSRTQVASMLLAYIVRYVSSSRKVTIFACAIKLTDGVQSEEMKDNRILTRQSHQQ